MENISAAMSNNSTLFGAIMLVGALAYLGALAFDPTYALARLIAGYLCGAALVLIGAGALYYGLAYEAPLIFIGAYQLDPMRMQWIGVGILALIAGALVVRQAFRRM